MVKHMHQAGLLTLLSGSQRLPDNSQWHLVACLKDNLQQRDCPGFPPDSLFITRQRVKPNALQK